MKRILRRGRLGALGLAAAGPRARPHLSASRAPIRRSPRSRPTARSSASTSTSARRSARRWARPATLVKVDWDGIIPALLEKKCDAIVASMSATEERKQVIDFSGQILPGPEPLRRPRPTPASIDTPEGMAGKVVGVQRGTIHQAYMEAHYPDTELRALRHPGRGRPRPRRRPDRRADGRHVSLDDGLPQDPGRRGLRLLRRGEPLRPGDPRHRRRDRRAQGGHRRCATSFSAAIAAIRADGTYQEISEKYFGTDIYGD